MIESVKFLAIFAKQWNSKFHMLQHRISSNWIDWNAMTGDAEPKKNRPTTVEGTVNMLNKTINANKSSGCVVILMHDALGKKLTVKSLQSIIDNLKNRGYAFATIN